MGKRHNTLDYKYFHKTNYIKALEKEYNIANFKKEYELQFNIMYDVFKTLIVLNNIIFADSNKNKDDKCWWYSPDGLTYYKGDWKQINGNWFRFDADGYAYQNCWFKYDKDNKLIYSWVLNGEIVSTVSKFNLNVIDKLENGDKFKKAFNYADGVFLDFSNCLEIPSGVIFKYFVGEKYTSDDVIYLYTYNDENGEISKVSENVKVSNGFLELEISEAVKHFASQTVVMNAKDKTEVNTWMYAAIGEVVFIVLLVILFMIIYSRKGKPKKEKKPKVNDVPVVTHVKDVYTGPVDNSMVKTEVSTEPVENTEIVANTGNPLVDKSTQVTPVITQSTPVTGGKKKMNTNSASSIVENLKPTPNNFKNMPEVKEK